MDKIPSGLDDEDNSTIRCFVDDESNERVTFMNISHYFAYRAQGMSSVRAHIATIQNMASYLESEVAV